jgi:signal transduction histidine kinase
MASFRRAIKGLFCAQVLWRRLAVFGSSQFAETRTRLIIFYAAMMSGMIAIAIPIGNRQIIRLVADREQRNLEEVIENFRDSLAPFIAAKSSQVSKQDVEKELNQFLTKNFPEDDVFLVSIVGSAFKTSSPLSLPAQFRPNSSLMRQWEALTSESRGRVETSDPSIQSIIYYASPLTIDEQVVAVFVAVQTTAGELREADEIKNLLTWLSIGFLLFSLFLTWLLSNLVLAPLRSLASTTHSIGESNLAERLPVSGHGELAEISRSFNGMMDRLQALITSQKELIQNAGHELRTPITIIRGNIELLHDDDEEPREETIRLVLDEVDRMSIIIDDLVLLAKADRPDFLRIKIMNVAQFTQDLFRKVECLAPRIWSLSEVAHLAIEADEQRLFQCMINLAVNATQHTCPSESIAIGSSVGQDGMVRFWIEDSGEGLSEDLKK